jgi:hypothetical protein
MLRVVSLLVGLLLVCATPAQAGPKVAIFPFEMIDTSLVGHYIGPQAEETARLKLATEELRKLVARDAGYEVLDLGGFASEIEKSTPLYKCNGCQLGMARRAGAQVAITGTVLKISNLLLSFHIYISDAASGKVTKIQHVEVRGNTDESWLRGVRRLVREGLNGG